MERGGGREERGEGGGVNSLLFATYQVINQAKLFSNSILKT